MAERERVGVGLLGAGVVGGGLLEFYASNPRFRNEVEILGVLVKDPSKPRKGNLPPSFFTTNPDDILKNPDVKIVVSLLGEETIEDQMVRRALKAKKFVVFGNKNVVAKNSPELSDLAEENSVGLLYEAAVAGAVPIVGNLIETLSPNTFDSIEGIVNGTTNYILTRMAEGCTFGDALREAQEKGFAEPDPTYDVEGYDAAYKLAVLSTLAFRTFVAPDKIHTEGITQLDPLDFVYADELGYVIKLVASGKVVDGRIETWVGPAMVRKNHMLADVKGSMNGLLLRGEPIKPLKFEGEGAGAEPTVASVASDIYKAATHIRQGTTPVSLSLDQNLEIAPFEECHNRHAIRMRVCDRAGTLGKIFTIIGNHNVNIKAVEQPDSGVFENGEAEMVIVTDPTEEGNLARALEEITHDDVCYSIPTVLRVLI